MASNQKTDSQHTRNKHKTTKLGVKNSEGFVYCDVCNELVLYENTGFTYSISEIEERCLPFTCRICVLERGFETRIVKIENDNKSLEKELAELQQQVSEKDEIINNLRDLVTSVFPDNVEPELGLGMPDNEASDSSASAVTSQAHTWATVARNNKTLHTRLNQLEKTMVSAQSKVNENHNGGPDTHIDRETLQEMERRQAKKKNIVLFGVRETEGGSRTDRKTEDRKAALLRLR